MANVYVKKTFTQEILKGSVFFQNYNTVFNWDKKKMNVEYVKKTLLKLMENAIVKDQIGSSIDMDNVCPAMLLTVITVMKMIPTFVSSALKDMLILNKMENVYALLENTKKMNLVSQ